MSTATIDRKKLAVIHIAKKTLGLREEEYRALLQGACNISSASEIKTDRQFQAVMKALEHAGYKSQLYQARGADQWDKCRALWMELYYAGRVHNPSEEALEAYAKKYRAYKDGRGLQRLIEILKQWRERR